MVVGLERDAPAVLALELVVGRTSLVGNSMH